MSAQHYHESILTVVVGFILAVANHVFGWFSHAFIFLQNSLLSQSLQALLTGFLGATAAYVTNKFWKYVDKKRKAKKENA